MFASNTKATSIFSGLNEDQMKINRWTSFYPEMDKYMYQLWLAFCDDEEEVLRSVIEGEKIKQRMKKDGVPLEAEDFPF